MPEVEVQESRRCERFLVEPPIAGAFRGAPVDIIDLAERGLRAQHPDPLRPGTAGVISLQVPGGRALQLQAEIVWCRLSTNAASDGKLLYLSGFRFEEASPELSRALGDLVELDKARPYRDSLERKKSKRKGSRPRAGSSTMKVIRQHRRIDEDTLLLVKQAWNYMKENPVEANKWYNRGKYALKEGETPKLHNKDDVLAIWEYLERIVPLDRIEWVLDNEHLV